MAAGKRRYTNGPSRDTDRRRQLYVYGNAVPKPEFVPERQQEVPGRQRKTSAQVKKNRNRARQINPAYVMFLAVATVIAVVVCIHYLQLQAELTQHSRQITALQEELNDLTEKNDTAYSAAEDSVNLEEHWAWTVRMRLSTTKVPTAIMSSSTKAFRKAEFWHNRQMFQNRRKNGWTEVFTRF